MTGSRATAAPAATARTVDLGIDRRHFDALVAQHLTDLRQPRAAAQQLGGERVPSRWALTGAIPARRARANTTSLTPSPDRASIGACDAQEHRPAEAARATSGGSRRAPRPHRQAEAAGRSASACRGSRSRPPASPGHRAQAPATSPQRSPSLASSIKIAKSRRPSVVARSQLSSNSSTSARPAAPAAGPPVVAAPTAPPQPTASRSSPARAGTATAPAARTPPSRPSAA